MISGTPGRVGVIGGGVMGQALVGAMLEAGVDVDDLVVCEPAAARATEVSSRFGVRAADSARKVASRCDVLVLAVKPADLDQVLGEVREALDPGTVVVSVAAGVPCAFYERRLADATPVVRVMPNTPALVGQGASAVCAGAHATPEHLEQVRTLLARTGLVLTVPEKHMDAVTAVSGSGPAYVFYLLDALAEAGVLLGLPRDQATQLATATFRGAVALQEETGEHPVVLRERVSSPGGTTVAAVRQLDVHGVRAGVLAAAEAARDRSRELAAEQD
ncbi:pyrroline-5-carboxylate reductase [Cellulomonas bogoriensis]|uniref:Pyrroline-5-carboxylate reductase n=1 Tax=Cellulomonas bogoriensis 69B4 = DSM 16987 TaxID=1386082 RepID=A0A0A0BM94_9CELL|nr:pyrroline-5-carboxylate reductase [Cellulomonas bogoriensis]KGM09030.1 pyrroline-5-carboxylate reductase [Cellulomonas bogoriensis 69B4 = DSM 16987]